MTTINETYQPIRLKLGDGHKKVVLTAVQGLKKLLEKHFGHFKNMHKNIIGSILELLPNMNMQIKQESTKLLKLFIANDSSQLLCNSLMKAICQTGNWEFKHEYVKFLSNFENPSALAEKNLAIEAMFSIILDKNKEVKRTGRPYCVDCATALDFHLINAKIKE